MNGLGARGFTLTWLRASWPGAGLPGITLNQETLILPVIAAIICENNADAEELYGVSAY